MFKIFQIEEQVDILVEVCFLDCQIVHVSVIHLSFLHSLCL